MFKSIIIFLFLIIGFCFQISCSQRNDNISVNKDINKSIKKELTQKESEDELEEKKRIVNNNRIYHNWFLQDTDKQLISRKLIPLRIKIIEDNDIEIRFWYGFGESLYGP